MQAKEIAVFLGPSYPVEEARKILPATYLPPAEQGDLAGVAADLRPRVIALMDGVFLSRPAVWHKEVLYALSRGIHVFGASSMGALRASELAPFGMVGSGTVYAMYAAGELDDDEVALVHHGADRGFAQLTEPMVNVRATLRQAVRDGLIDQPACQMLTAIAKNIFFGDRTRGKFFEAAAKAGALPAALPAYFETSYVDVKRADAIELLRRLQQLPDDLPPFQPDFELANNRLFQTLFHKDAALFEGGAKISRGDVATYYSVQETDFEALNFDALNRGLVQVLGAMLGVEVGEEEVTGERRRFRLKNGLTQDPAFEAWLVENHIERADFDDLMRQRAVCRRLHNWLWLKHGRLGSLKMVTEELVMRNRYAATLRKTAMQQQILDSFAPFLIESEAGSDIKIEELLRDHCRQTGFRPDQPYPKWTREANFPSVASFEYELIRARQARELLARMFTPAS